MATETAPLTTQLRLASANGPVTRTILQTPLRDATAEEIPIIDVSPMFGSELADRKALAKQIRDAATNMGFFYIKNHGDMETKMKADSYKTPHQNGYRGPDTQRINPDEGIDVREGFSYRYDPKNDPEVEDPDAVPEEVRRLLKCEEYPWEKTANMPSFKERVVAYYRECLKLARALTRAFALSLELPEAYFDDKVRYPDGAFGLNYYPPIPQPRSPGDPGARVSIGSHTDFQLFTILWQDLSGGLQVLSREGQWLNAAPVRDTFVVNIADCLQRITNDVYVSTVHRAQNWSGGRG
ncbi:2-oxoglutarate-Fe(II) type oxidoreductase ppzC [Cladobotryum mycophilum]|uniref:2-oxoglutarate-Fe(II) type oxidoreductase ppzC n=1 Tax=Cladobotryum mycophilum TaxID=491253 RepID=A0ABR0SBE5_9HYPO